MNEVSETTKKLLIVDDHPLVREGMQLILESEPNLNVVGTAASVSEALKQVESLHPDLVITDLTLPNGNGLGLIKDLKALHPRIPVLVISMHNEEIYAERVLYAGGRGYLMKDSASEQILKAVKSVLKGGVYVSQATSDRFLDVMAGGGTGTYSFPFQRLSDREIEIFEMIGHGLSPQEISGQLGISSRTFDSHRTHIRKKLRLSDSHAVLAHAIKWVESDPEAEKQV